MLIRLISLYLLVGAQAYNVGDLACGCILTQSSHLLTLFNAQSKPMKFEVCLCLPDMNSRQRVCPPVIVRTA